MLMAVSFFEKSRGFETLAVLYHLTETDIEWMQDELFDYETEPLTRKQVEDCIQSMHKFMPEESEESLEQTRRSMLDRNGHIRWPKENASELFKEKHGEINMFSTDFTLRHIAAVIDYGGEH